MQGRSGMAKDVYDIRAQWDREAEVWIATSDDVPGLCCEADTFDSLVEEVVSVAPDLLIGNQVVVAAGEVILRFSAERRAVARLVA